MRIFILKELNVTKYKFTLDKKEKEKEKKINWHIVLFLGSLINYG